MSSANEKKMTLWDLKPGEVGRITLLNKKVPANVRARLHRLGFSIGEKVLCVQHTPFGGPRSYRVGTALFSLESHVARSLHIRAREAWE